MGSRGDSVGAGPETIGSGAAVGVVSLEDTTWSAFFANRMLLARANTFRGSSSVAMGIGVGVVERTTGLFARTAGRRAGLLELGAGSSVLVEVSEAGSGLMAVVGVTVEAGLAAGSGDVSSRRFLAPQKISGQRISV
jgi:hypothetical protein